MPKDFEEFKSEAKNYTDYQQPRYSVDPNLFVNEASSKEIMAKNKLVQMVNIAGTACLSLLTAPLTTAQISLQLSVLAHKNKYGDVTELEKNQIANIPKEVTAYDKRRYELIIKSGVTGANKPFRAPVYTSYKEVFQALGNQGLLGFYKGNLLGLLHTWFGTFTRLQALHNLEYNNHHFYQKSNNFMKGFYVTMVCTTVDMLVHPIQLMQSRFVLQNRLPNFSLYKSVFHFMKKHTKSPKTFFQGVGTHIPKNLIFSISHLNFFKNNPKEGFMLSNLIAQVISYPLTTVLRRLHCQDTLPGMLPVRYSGWWHATKLIFIEEGVRGLYRGFLAYATVNAFMTMLIFHLTFYSDYAYDLKSEQS